MENDMQRQVYVNGYKATFAGLKQMCDKTDLNMVLINKGVPTAAGPKASVVSQSTSKPCRVTYAGVAQCRCASCCAGSVVVLDRKGDPVIFTHHPRATEYEYDILTQEVKVPGDISPGAPSGR